MTTPLSIQQELAQAYQLRRTEGVTRRGVHFTIPREDTNSHCINILIGQTTTLAEIVQHEQHKLLMLTQEAADLRANDAEEIRAIKNLNDSQGESEKQMSALSAKTDAIAAGVSILETTTVTRPRVEAVETILNDHTKSIADTQNKIDAMATRVTQQDATLTQIQAELVSEKKKRDFEEDLSECLSLGQSLGFVDPTLSLPLFEVMLKHDFDIGAWRESFPGFSYERFPRGMINVYKGIGLGTWTLGNLPLVTPSIHQRSQEVKAKAASLSQDIAALKASSSQTSTKGAILEKRLETIEGQYAIKATLEQHSQTTAAAHAALHGSVTGLRTELDATKQTVEKQTAALFQIGRTQDADRESQKKALESMQTQQAAAQQKIVELQAAASQTHAKSTSLEQHISQKVDIAVHDLQVAALKATQEEHTCSLSSLTDRTATKEVEMLTLKKALFRESEKVNLLERENGQLRSDLQETASKVAELEKTLAMLVSSMKKRKSKLASSKKVKGLKQRIEVIDDKMKHGFSGVKERLDGQEKEMGDLRFKISEFAVLTSGERRRSREFPVSPVAQQTGSISPRKRVEIKTVEF